MAAIDPRAIPSQAYSRYNRVIQYNAGPPGGLLCLPASDLAPDGWGNPFENDAGVAINPPLGTVGGSQPFNLVVRAPPPSSVVSLNRSQSFFNIGEIDWRSPQTDVGPLVVATWRGAPSRYFPSSRRTDSGPETPAFNQPVDTAFFRDKIRIDGPGGDIRGVGARNVDTTDAEWIVVTGDQRTEFEFWKRRFDLAGGWVSLGTIDQSISSPGDLNHPDTFRFWKVSFLFNNTGTRAVATIRFDGSGTGSSNAGFYLWDVTVGASTLTAKSITGPLHTSKTGSRTTAQSSSSSGTTFSPDCAAGPACPTTVPSIGTSDSSFSQSSTFGQTQSCTVGHDFDEDGNLVTLEWAFTESADTSANSVSDRTIETTCCLGGGGPQFGPTTKASQTSTASHSASSLFEYTWTINGGPGSGTTITIPMTVRNLTADISRDQELDTVIFSCISETVSGLVQNLAGDNNKLYQFNRGRVLALPANDLRIGTLAFAGYSEIGTEFKSIGPTPNLDYIGNMIGGPPNPCGNGPGGLSNVQGTTLGQVSGVGFDGCPSPITPCRLNLSSAFGTRQLRKTLRVEGQNGLSLTDISDSDKFGYQHIFPGNTIRAMGGTGGFGGTIPILIPPFGTTPINEPLLDSRLLGSQQTALLTVDVAIAGNGIADRFGDTLYSFDTRRSPILMQGFFAFISDSAVWENPDRYNFDYTPADLVALTEVDGENPRFHPIGIV